MVYKKKKILVTGGNGYIGSHTIVKLINAGYSIIVLDNFSNSSIKIREKIYSLVNKNYEFIKGDVRDRKVLRNIFKDHEINAVIHFAALKSVAESEIKPLTYYENNVFGSLVLFQEMQIANVNAIIFSSSATIYGEPPNPRCKETNTLNPSNVYGRTKLIVENILKDIYKINPEWKIINLRYFNPVGAHPSGLIGENPKGIPNNLMPYISQVASGLRDQLLVFGEDYNTPDGTGRRDYIHVDDLAEGHLAALKKIQKSENLYLNVNLGTGKSYSVLEVIKSFERVTGQNIPLKITKRRKGDVAEVYADVEYAKIILNWRAKFDLDKMCEDTWRWQHNNPKGLF